VLELMEMELEVPKLLYRKHTYTYSNGDDTRLTCARGSDVSPKNSQSEINPVFFFFFPLNTILLLRHVSSRGGDAPGH